MASRLYDSLRVALEGWSFDGMTLMSGSFGPWLLHGTGRRHARIGIALIVERA